MARGEMLTVFCYDVSDNRRRRRISKILEKSAIRVQYSVFETRMNEGKTNAICQQIAVLLQDGDSLRVYVIGANGERRTRIFGDGPPVQNNAGYWLV